MTGRLRGLLLWVGAGLGLLGAAALVLVWFFGFSFLVFRSGSMTPSITTGSLALAHETRAADVRPGEVVSVVSESGSRITHRVVRVADHGGLSSLVLQGDANATPDEEVYVVRDVERVSISVPGLGYAIAFLLTPGGLILAGCVGCALVVVAPGREEQATTRPHGRRRRLGRRRGRPTAGVLVTADVVATATAGGGVADTLASFTDSATLASGGLTSADLLVPAAPTSRQTPSTSVVALSWAATAAGATTATAYEVLRFAAATGGTGTSVCTTSGALSCSDGKQAGTVYYGLRAKIGTAWVEESTRTTYAPDVTGPSLTLTQPKTTNVTAAALRTQVAGCAPAGIACGTAADPGGVASVEYTLRRQVTAANGTVTTYCWSGSAWGQSPDATCDIFLTATATTTWVVPGSSLTAYPNGTKASFLLTLRATDGFGNIFGPGTVSYTVTG